jgi:hypothetical protein
MLAMNSLCVSAISGMCIEKMTKSACAGMWSICARSQSACRPVGHSGSIEFSVTMKTFPNNTE